MYRNIGKFDRLLRIVMGLILILSGIFYLTGYIGWTAVFVGIILLATGVVGWCGMYSIVGFSSKGHGIDKITRKDIQRAVREGAIDKPVEKKKKSTPKKKKKVVKKKASAKPATKKSVTIKTTKKATPVKKKPVAKKKTTSTKKSKK